MKTKHNKEIDNVEDLKKFIGKSEDIEEYIYENDMDIDDFDDIYSSKKGEEWLKRYNYMDNKFGEMVCYECRYNLYDRMRSHFVCSYRGKLLCDANDCKTEYIEELLDTAEDKIKNLEENSIDTLLLKYDNGNHFKLFSKILLPQFIRGYNKKDNNTKSLKNLYNYFKRINLEYGLRPHKDNNKYYRCIIKRYCL